MIMKQILRKGSPQTDEFKNFLKEIHSNDYETNFEKGFTSNR